MEEELGWRYRWTQSAKNPVNTTYPHIPMPFSCTQPASHPATTASPATTARAVLRTRVAGRKPQSLCNATGTAGVCDGCAWSSAYFSLSSHPRTRTGKVSGLSSSTPFTLVMRRVHIASKKFCARKRQEREVLHAVKNFSARLCTLYRMCVPKCYGHSPKTMLRPGGGTVYGCTLECGGQDALLSFTCCTSVTSLGSEYLRVLRCKIYSTVSTKNYINSRSTVL